ncbi:arginine--tRNA ligase, cytoplasmic-like isoform X1 [Sycon ciliatum]|uniref:arginine--tRNA ligase, cytoplasmic-like isoform X1 n=1 Tax=Sycon ciliatum TaxID=27933 RepID=UPI0031F68B24
MDQEDGELVSSLESIAAEKKCGCAGAVRSASHMTDIVSHLRQLFNSAITAAYPQIQKPSALIALGKKGVDYQVNSAMSLTKELKATGVNANPRQIAEAIVKNCPPSDLVDKLEVAGPGFINIHIKVSVVSGLLSDVLTHGVRAPDVGEKRRVVIDYSSPNIAKQMHVGHLRSTVIGDCLARIIEYCGHDVLRLNHIGDWGTQFGMLIAHLEDKFPNFESESPPIGDLQSFYKESKVRFDGEEDFKKRAYKNVVLLQGGDKKIRTGWSHICEISRHEFAQIYSRLGIGKELVERGESFYQPLMNDVIHDLKSRDLISEEDGCKVLHLKKQKVPLILEKSVGGYTYDTSDVAALRHRLQEEKASWLVYVVDAGQGLHFQQIFEGAKIAGYSNDSCRIEHVGFGLVLGEGKKKLKSRSGDTVKLKELLDEGVERSAEKLKERGRDEVLSPEELAAARDAVAYGCIKYADLCHQRTHDYVFSFDKMLDDKGNTAVYLLYAYTRIQSIIRLAKSDSGALTARAATTELVLGEAAEVKLAKHVLRFAEVIQRIHEDLLPHVLCEYLYDLSTHFTEFYDSCYCVEKDRETGEVLKINWSRILICEATARVMAKGLSLLGITTVDRM